MTPSHVVTNEYDKVARRQFIITQVNLTALVHLYGRNPRKTELDHVVLEPFPPGVDTIAGAGRTFRARKLPPGLIELVTINVTTTRAPNRVDTRGENGRSEAII